MTDMIRFKKGFLNHEKQNLQMKRLKKIQGYGSIWQIKCIMLIYFCCLPEPHQNDRKEIRNHK